MSDVVITLVEPHEFDENDALVAAAYEHDYGPRDRGDDDGDDPMRRTKTRSQGFDVWVARDANDNALLGTVTTPKPGGEQLMEDATPEEFDFRLLAVSPDARRRGIGAALTTHIIDVARERGYERVFMKSAPNMIGAHQLYEALGFRRDYDRDGLIIGGQKVFDLYAFVIDVPAAASDSTPQFAKEHDA